MTPCNNNEMKKAVKEVTAIETAKLAKNPRFTIDDLVKIINEEDYSDYYSSFCCNF